jgi:transcription-repair coupling factor (superfamily II helicase)
MDRLVCGDVGFGKTEVALRTAFIAVMSGKQVAVVVPTTLLARQHYATFCERFHGYPVRHRPDLAPGRRARRSMRCAKGDWPVGRGRHRHRHPCAAQQEQVPQPRAADHRRGAAFRRQAQGAAEGPAADMHVLTLTATPIPRTLQLALSGVRELSLITTPPLDRLAVRTFISPFDPVIVREMLLREHYRGGQSFYVVPRIADIDEVREFLPTRCPR